MQSEVLTLERRQLDLDAGTLRLDSGMTKNDDGRLVYLTPELKALLSAASWQDHPLPLPSPEEPSRRTAGARLRKA